MARRGRASRRQVSSVGSHSSSRKPLTVWQRRPQRTGSIFLKKLTSWGVISLRPPVHKTGPGMSEKAPKKKSYGTTCTVVASPSSHVFLRSLARFVVPCNGHITSCGEVVRERVENIPVSAASLGLCCRASVSCPVQASSSPWHGNCCARTGKGEKKQKQKRRGATYPSRTFSRVQGGTHLGFQRGRHRARRRES